ncbi:MAG TPA: DUF3822 family protein [Mucilaginibacter sp.]
MNDHDNNYTNNGFNLYQAYSYTLLLQVWASSFSYAVVHQNRLLVSAQNCDLDELAHPKQLSELLKATYKKVIIGMPATALTLVPKSLYSEGGVAGFARFLDINENEKVFAQTLDDQNMVIYKTNAALVSAVEKFNLKNVVYTAQGWIKAIANSNPPKNNLYLEIGNDSVQFLYFLLGSLRFYNTFEFKGEDELAYFTSFVAEELQLKPQQITLVLSGDITDGDKNMKRLADFYPGIEINGLAILELPGQIPSHKLLALAALSLCGSSEGR